MNIRKLEELQCVDLEKINKNKVLDIKDIIIDQGKPKKVLNIKSSMYYMGICFEMIQWLTDLNLIQGGCISHCNSPGLDLPHFLISDSQVRIAIVKNRDTADRIFPL